MPNKASTCWHVRPPRGLTQPTAKETLVLSARRAPAPSRALPEVRLGSLPPGVLSRCHGCSGNALWGGERMME